MTLMAGVPPAPHSPTTLVSWPTLQHSPASATTQHGTHWLSMGRERFGGPELLGTTIAGLGDQGDTGRGEDYLELRGCFKINCLGV